MLPLSGLLLRNNWVKALSYSAVVGYFKGCPTCKCEMMAASADQHGVQMSSSPPTWTPKSQNKSRFLGEEVLASGEWLSLNKIHYQDPHGVERTWECIERTTRQARQSDGVVIMAILKRMLKYDCIVLVKQFRPPVRGYTLEFPAGLVDQGEDVVAAAQREMKEETGYTCIVKHASPAVSLDAGTENCTTTIVTAEIDGDDPVNKKPEPKPDDAEFIEVLHIPVVELLSRVNDFAQQGVVVDSRVYSYAIALTQATKEKRLELAQK